MLYFGERSRANGVAERLNSTLLNDCRTLLRSSGLSLHLRFHAVQFSTLMRNSLITSTTGTSSRAKAGLAGLDVSTILPFGQRVMVNLTPTNKLQPRGLVGFALNPSTESHGYLIYIPSKHRVVDTSSYVVIRGEPLERDNPDVLIDPLIEQLEARQYEFRSQPVISGGWYRPRCLTLHANDATGDTLESVNNGNYTNSIWRR